MLSLDRRQFLGGSLTALGAGLLPLRFGASARSDNILVIIQLAGGNDGLATITPREDDRYYRARPTIAVPKRRLLKLNDLNGFHPALKRIAARFAEGQVCIHQGVGHPNANLSHFRSADVWSTASTDTVLPPIGWIGKQHDLRGKQSSPVPLLAAGANRMPRDLVNADHSACVVSSLESYGIQSNRTELRSGVDHARLRAMAALHATKTDGPLAELHDAWGVAERSIAELRRAERFQIGGNFGGGALGRNLELVARVIGTGLDTRCFHVMQGGYDTHAEQARTHPEQLRALDAALDGLMNELERQGNLERTMILTVSEFGRRVAESGIGETAGTDHGAGNCLMAFGGRVHAGLHGAQPDLENLDENGNLIHRHDFRGIYADILDNWLGADSRAVLGQEFRPVRVVGRA